LNGSSTAPSQLSSTWLQSSALGEPATAEHVRPFCVLLQRWLPYRMHAPTPAVQAEPSPAATNVSSTPPLQLSSIALHISAVGV
jgi:hypothetical protein